MRTALIKQDIQVGLILEVTKYIVRVFWTDLMVNMSLANPMEVVEVVFRIASLHSVTDHVLCIIVKSVPEPCLGK